MKEGTKSGGMNCLIINSNIQEIDLHTNEELDALIEINLPTEDMIYLLKNIYEDWKEMKVEIKELAYDIIRNERHILLKQMLLRLLFRNKTIKGRVFPHIFRETPLPFNYKFFKNCFVISFSFI